MFQFIRNAVKSVATKVLEYSANTDKMFLPEIGLLTKISLYIGADVNHQYYNGETQLHQAVRHN